jgi:hypothetical protein
MEKSIEFDRASQQQQQLFSRALMRVNAPLLLTYIRRSLLCLDIQHVILSALQHNNLTLFNFSNILLKHFKVRLKNSMKNSFVKYCSFKCLKNKLPCPSNFENFRKITKRC